MGFRFARYFLSLLLAIFFRRVRRVGEGRVPSEGGLIYTANHVNSLLDPLLLLCCAPRTPRFLAKEPLFRHPFVAPFLRVLEALPVYRRQDEGADTAKNRETFAACVRALGEGEAVALFPEGRSHSEPHLQPLKTGAARIAGLAIASGVRAVVVPVGLNYSARSTFRSDAALLYGPPVNLAELSFGDGDEPEAVRELTGRIEEALESVTLNAERFEDLDLVDTLLPVARDLLPDGTTEEEIGLRRAFLQGYYEERGRRPAEVAALEAAVRSYRKVIRGAGIQDDDIAGWKGTPGALARALPGVALAAAAYPPALYGFLFHFVPYTLAGPAAQMVNREADTLGTYKLYAGLLLYPLSYALQTWALAQVAGWAWALAAAAAAIPAGIWSLRYYEFRHGALCRAWAALFLASNRRRSELLALRAAVLAALRPFVGDRGIGG
jgi:1-acyl-sn-glycerol-3-phosphate acyltransferase